MPDNSRLGWEQLWFITSSKRQIHWTHNSEKDTEYDKHHPSSNFFLQTSFFFLTFFFNQLYPQEHDLILKTVVKSLVLP